MTGVTEVVRAAQRVYWLGRFGLLAMLARMPPAMQRAVKPLLMVTPGEQEALANPLGPMPMPRLEYFQERSVGGPSSRTMRRANAQGSAPGPAAVPGAKLLPAPSIAGKGAAARMRAPAAGAQLALA